MSLTRLPPELIVCIDCHSFFWSTKLSSTIKGVLTAYWPGLRQQCSQSEINDMPVVHVCYLSIVRIARLYHTNELTLSLVLKCSFKKSKTGNRWRSCRWPSFGVMECHIVNFNTKKMKTSKAWLYILFSLSVCVYLKKRIYFTIQLYLAIKGVCNTFYTCTVEGYTV